ncbi:hypothetical protein [Solirubrobacter soli]|uniref:hypothetical protein n=1 Tax=Solirubrobacter soli TaxID=363832 RepID=UPI0004853AE1|nr:hypothetical protein [Solirubrobacter soli]
MADSRSPAVDVLVATLGAAGAALGGLGFVAAVGATTMQARFRGAGLPSELASSLESRGVDVAVGIEVILPALIVAVGIVALVHWVPVRWPARTWRWWAFGGLIVVAGFLDYFFVWARQASGTGTQIWILLGVLVVSVACAAAAVKLARSARRELEPLGQAMHLLGLLGVVSLLGALVAVAGNWGRPVVRPAAVVLKGTREIVCGVYVGQNGGATYIGVVYPSGGGLGNHDRGTIVAIPRAHVARMAVGASMGLDKAVAQAGELGAEFGGTKDCTPLVTPSDA